MRIAKRINERLAEEKRRNKHLEETARSLSSYSVYPQLTTTSNDSYLSEEVMQLKRQLEDRDAKVEVLKTELDTWKVELKAVDEAWRKLDAEASGVKDCDEVLQSWVSGLPTEAKYSENYSGESSLDVNRALLHMVFFTTLRQNYIICQERMLAVKEFNETCFP